MLIRPLAIDDVDLQQQLGGITVATYRALIPGIDEDGYALELADVARRVKAAVVLVALDGNVVLGGVTHVPDEHNPFAEIAVANAASIRMLAVDPGAQGRGVGESLVRACLARAESDGRAEVVLHSTTAMTTAHRLYLRLGFRRAEELDWCPEPDLLLMGFRRAVVNS